ncbi:DUF262 domain-containing protein [Williamsia muralis]|uniref:DUF262 domain-containing protein n=1 Tax=Williamsia marianensis TaxID=85044 RepID=UPI003F13AFB4
MDNDRITANFKKAQDRLVQQASDLSLESIASMVANNAIDVAPEFQRRERWSPKQASALIESFLLNIPVPPIYLAEEEFGSYSVIDGKQRITAIHSFMRDELTLTGLSRFTEIEGLRFTDLPVSLSNALQVRPYIRVVTLLRQSDPVIKYEVFHRLNSGGEPLLAQEIRNVIYRGPLNDLLFELAANTFLRKKLKIRDNRSPNYRTMQDVEYVLRFFTLESSWSHFGGDFRKSMDQFMMANQFLGRRQLMQLEGKFIRSLGACEQILGEIAFKRYGNGAWRDQTLAAVYEAQMIAMSMLSEAELERLQTSNRARVRPAIRKLFQDPDFDLAVRTGTNTPTRVVYRVEEMVKTMRRASRG